MKRQKRAERPHSSPPPTARRFTRPVAIAALAGTIAVAGAAALAMRFVMHGEPVAATSRPSSRPAHSAHAVSHGLDSRRRVHHGHRQRDRACRTRPGPSRARRRFLDDGPTSPTPSSAGSSRRPATSPRPRDRSTGRRSASSFRRHAQTADARSCVPGSLVFTRRPRGAAQRPVALVAVDPRRDWRHPEGPRQHDRRQGRSPGRAGVLGRRGRVREVGRQAASHRGRVGIRRPRRPGRQAVRLGRRTIAARRAHGQHVRRRVPVPPDAGRTASPARRPSNRSRRTATACTTWPATSGSGRPINTGPTSSRAARTRASATTRRDRRPRTIPTIRIQSAA